MKILKKYYILGLLAIHLCFIIFLRSFLSPIHFAQKDFPISIELLMLLDLGNLILIWLISKKIFSKFSSIAPLIYAIIPWSSYLVSAQSFYIYLLFLELLAFFLYISSPPKKILVSLLLIPLFLGFKNILSGEIKIFSDPGLINMVNSYQGAARNQDFGFLAKVSENKYLFTTEYILLKYMKHLVPTTYFTSQEKLLNFSFSPPIYFGFLIPFLFGLYQLSKDSRLRKLLLVSTILVTPSILARQMVDLNRLVLFSPVIIFITSFGIVKLYDQNKKIAKFFLFLTLMLVIFQFLTTISDISLRERERYIKYFGENFEIGKQ